MKLQEKEAKKLLKEHGLTVPQIGLDGDKEYVLKAQVLANHRKENGGIKFAKGEKQAKAVEKEMKAATVDGKEVKDVLIEEKIDFEKEYYVSFTYDTETRKPALIFSEEGGTGIEDREVLKLPLEDSSQFRFRQFLAENGFEGKEIIKLGAELQKLFKAFLETDGRLLEVNPLAKTSEGYVVLDAMMDLDDDAGYRHSWDYPERSAFDREKTSREIRAKKIDENDHRGVAGKYTELEGDIGMMLAGGGASLTNMDALIACGGKPANYTEYGGNPPTEKVYKLSKVIMSKELNGLWHVGGTANNTNILRTMKGFVQALEEEKPDYPIVIRRDGPNADEAFELLREKKEELDLNMKLFRNDTPMTETAETLMEMVETYREGPQ
ncbi:ATP-grasp domain-containing protein [Candidatus Nanohalococcus occultus]|uniref:ATP-grasp domain-containing protein n=1 Tax=Candidatus Nanohalococcus occultus TaxID=2978047 RepID=UPI0039E0DFC1